MIPTQSDQAEDLGFLEQYKTDSETFSLHSGAQVSIQKYFIHFHPWIGAPIPDTYNGKAVINWDGEPVFAELAVLRLFQSHGWDGVWVDSYRRKYRIGLPGVVEPVDLPQKQQELIDSIRSKTGRLGGCWDVLVWKNDQLLFIELKRVKKDNIRDAQVEWLASSLESGLTNGKFALVEWTLFL